jgi:hypothetical protein
MTSHASKRVSIRNSLPILLILAIVNVQRTEGGFEPFIP